MKDKISCPICGFLAYSLSEHIKKDHNLSKFQFYEKYPGSIIRNSCRKINIGDSFGKLTVIKYIPPINHSGQVCRRFLCKCSCGKEVKLNLQALKSNSACLKCIRKKHKEIKINDKIGNFIIVSICGKMLKCRCDCGEFLNIRKDALKIRKQKCCNNCRIMSLNGFGEVYYSYFNRIKVGAIKRNIVFNITIHDVWNQFLLQNKRCALTGLELSLTNTKKSGTASLDRIDSDVGYIKENIQFVHKDINMMKQDYKQDEFIRFCKLIHNNKVKNE